MTVFIHRERICNRSFFPNLTIDADQEIVDCENPPLRINLTSSYIIKWRKIFMLWFSVIGETIFVLALILWIH